MATSEGDKSNLVGSLQQQLLEQDKKHEEEEKKLRETIKEQERKLEEQGKCLEIQKKEMSRMVESLQEVMSKVSHMSDLTCLSRRFAIDNISVTESRITPIHWKSPAMYTHQFGYKFCIGADCSGNVGLLSAPSIFFKVWVMPGEFDDELKWPAKAKFMLELRRPKVDRKEMFSHTYTWTRSAQPYTLLNGHMGSTRLKTHNAFVASGPVTNVSLYFHVSNVELL